MSNTREGVVLDVIGPERGGKSDFACSLAHYSPPLHYFTLDYNYKAPVKRHIALGADIEVHPFFYNLPFAPPTSPKEKDFEKKVNAVAQATRPVFASFKERLWKILSEKRASIVIDNGTVLHYLCRLACYGYVHKIPRHLYAKRTNEMATIINQVRYSGKNVCWVHRWAEIWDKNDKPTGEFMRAGAFNPIAYDVMATLSATRNEERSSELGRPIFQVEVLDSTFGADLVGRRFVGKKRTFEQVATSLLEG